MLCRFAPLVTQVELKASFCIQRNISIGEIASTSSSSKLPDGNLIVCQPTGFFFPIHSRISHNLRNDAAVMLSHKQ